MKTKIHNHNHDHCKHVLEYCEKCDVVYCTKCYKEWSQYNWTWTYPNSSTTTITSPDFVCGSMGNVYHNH